MASLELTDIQGNILRGYGFPSAAYLFLSVADDAAGRGFLGETLPEITRADRWDQRPATTTNVALTYAGLRALGVEDSALSALPEALREPIRERAPRVLEDVGDSGPEQWDEGIGT